MDSAQLSYRLSKIHAYDNEDAFVQFLECLLETVPAQYGTIWKCNYISNTVSVIARAGGPVDHHNILEFVHGINNSVIGAVIDRLDADKHQATFYRYSQAHSPDVFSQHRSKERLHRLALGDLISVPFYNLHKDSEYKFLYGILNIYVSPETAFSDDMAAIFVGKLSDLMSASFLIKKQRISDKIVDIFEQSKSEQDNFNLMSAIVDNVLLPILRVEGASICEWDRYKNAYVTCASSDHNCISSADHIRRGLTGTVASINKTVVLRDLHNLTRDEEVLLGRKEKSEILHAIEYLPHRPRSFLGVPVLNPAATFRNMPSGIVRLVNKRTRIGEFVDFFDEDDRKHAEEVARLISLHEKNNHIEANRNAFALLFGHEAKAPASGIRGTAQRVSRLLNRGIYSSKQCDSLLQDIQDFADLIISLSDTLTFGLSDPALPRRQRYNPQYISLRKVIESAKRVVIPLCRGEGISFDNISIQGSFPTVFIDPSAWTQVFYNMLTNAIKYRDKEDKYDFRVIISCNNIERKRLPVSGIAGLLTDGRVNIGSRVDVDVYAVRVQDYGIGVPLEYAEAIFDEGVRVPAVSSTEIRGSGIGLPIVRRILRDFDCTVNLVKHNDPTIFEILIPVELETQEYANSPAWRLL